MLTVNDSIRTTPPTGKARRTTRWAAGLTQLTQFARWALPAALVVATGIAQAVVPSNCWDSTHPDSRYVVNSSAGTVKDNTTNLMWKQCVEGLSGSGCATGTSTPMNWAAGNSTASNSTQSGYNDWRMPTLTELRSLLPSACSNPKINTNVFSNTPAGGLGTWTGETSTAVPASAWIVSFYNGVSGAYDKTLDVFVVRLVRGGQSFDPSAPTAQTLAFTTPLPTRYLGSSPTLTATSNAGNANSGNPIRYSSTTPNDCSVDASTGQITLSNTAVAGNTCTIAADQYGRINNGVNYAPAAQVTRDLSVAKRDQTITFGAAPTSAVVNGAGYSVSASASSTLSVSLSIDSGSSGVCSLNGSTVSFTGAGTCKILANQAGDSSYNPAPQASQSFTIGAGTQTISFGTAPSLNVGGTGTVSATSDKGQTPVTFTSTTPAVCSVTGSTVTALTAGQCTIKADQAGNPNYNAASNTQNITIGRGTQTISFGAVPSIAVGGTGTVSATSDKGLTPVSFTSTTTGVCTVAGSTVTAVTAGQCTIKADQAGNPDYNPASNTQNITIGAGTQTITFGAVPSIAVGGTGTVSATSDKGLPVTFTSTTPAVCSVTGSTVTALTAGQCTIKADQAGNANYNAASNTQNIAIDAVKLVSGMTATGQGAASAGFSGGGAACSFDPNNTAFVVAPAAYSTASSQPFGAFKFKLIGCDVGSTARITVTWPSSIAGMVYMKYGKAAQVRTSANGFYAPKNLSINGSSASFDVTDGGWGDEDLNRNGEIVDPSGPILLDLNVAPVPTLQSWALLLLGLCMVGFATIAARRKAPSA